MCNCRIFNGKNFCTELQKFVSHRARLMTFTAVNAFKKNSHKELFCTIAKQNNLMKTINYNRLLN